jgi:2,3-bisphosphoglycerate-independent phosphoglycerate mutase
LVYVGKSGFELTQNGSLSDIAPTLLTLLDIDVPAEMTGQVLVAKKS